MDPRIGGYADQLSGHVYAGNPDYYLKHNFYKESSAYGLFPYIAEHCDPMEPTTM